MDNKKRIVIYGVSLLVFLILIFGTTYAFFNYTKTGNSNSMSTGEILFSSSDNLLIDISNDFPQDTDLSDEALNNMKNNHKGTLSITGNTTYEDGLKYRIYAIKGEDILGKQRLNDENIKLELTPNFVSGSSGVTITTNNYLDPTNLSFDNNGKALLATGIINSSNSTTVTFDYFMWVDGDNTLISSTTKRLILPEGNPSLADTTSGNVVTSRYLKNDNILVEDVTLFPAKVEHSGKTVYTTNEFSLGYYNIKIMVEAED